jgi:hypothetical protein
VRLAKAPTRLSSLAASFLFALCASLARAAPPEAAAPALSPRRVALVVGANAAAPGRKPLRFSQRDAEAFSRVLIEIGGFARDDVAVLLDPDPGAVLAALDAQLARVRASGQEALFLFYYSGHADATALYPQGRALALADLRARFADPRVSVRIGIIDACRGGGWTGAKGLSETAPFEVDLPSALASEGSVLIASSSGLEDAHESEALGGSFFTHHWIAALRGAGDRNGDGQITLTESFEYARALTIRDTALHTATPQHPSFSMQLRGRHDLALALVHSASSLLTVDQHQGPLELLHLDSGMVVLEIPKGERSMRLAVAPGRYLLRRRSGGKVWAQEITVLSGQTVRIDEERLILLGASSLAIKRAEPRLLTLTTLPKGKQEITGWFGVTHGSPVGARLATDNNIEFGVIGPRGLTDRWQWLLPTLAFVYRGGEHGQLEWLPWGGLVSWVMGRNGGEGFVMAANPGLGFDLRRWLTARSSLDFSFGLLSSLRWAARPPPNSVIVPKSDGSDAITRQLPESPQWTLPKTWQAAFSVGYTYTLADIVTFHFALALSQTQWIDGHFADHHLDSRQSSLRVGIGGVQNIALRPLPLVRIHVRDWFALNVDASVTYDFAWQGLDDVYLGGASFVW